MNPLTSMSVRQETRKVTPVPGSQACGQDVAAQMRGVLLDIRLQQHHRKHFWIAVHSTASHLSCVNDRRIDRRLLPYCSNVTALK